MNHKDSYECLLNHFNISKKDFFQFGLDYTIYPDKDMVREYWEALKKRLFNNEPVHIRGYGRDAKGTELYKEFHKIIFGNENIIKDSSNNTKPRNLIEKTTGLIRKKNLSNYQVSHIFGRTKNALLFTASWNIVYVPRVIDPLTGHECSESWREEYTYLFHEEVHKKYARYINEYNEIILKLDLEPKIKSFVQEESHNIINEFNNPDKKNRLLKDLSYDFSVI